MKVAKYWSWNNFTDPKLLFFYPEIFYFCNFFCTYFHNPDDFIPVLNFASTGNLFQNASCGDSNCSSFWYKIIEKSWTKNTNWRWKNMDVGKLCSWVQINYWFQIYLSGISVTSYLQESKTNVKEKPGNVWDTSPDYAPPND